MENVLACSLHDVSALTCLFRRLNKEDVLIPRCLYQWLLRYHHLALLALPLSYVLPLSRNTISVAFRHEYLQLHYGFPAAIRWCRSRQTSSAYYSQGDVRYYSLCPLQALAIADEIIIYSVEVVDNSCAVVRRCYADHRLLEEERWPLSFYPRSLEFATGDYITAIDNDNRLHIISEVEQEATDYYCSQYLEMKVGSKTLILILTNHQLIIRRGLGETLATNLPAIRAYRCYLQSPRIYFLLIDGRVAYCSSIALYAQPTNVILTFLPLGKAIVNFQVYFHAGLFDGNAPSDCLLLVTDDDELIEVNPYGLTYNSDWPGYQSINAPLVWL